MTADGLQIPTDALRLHAKAVDGIAEDVQLARGAAVTVAMDNQAYGVICQFLPALLNPLFELAVTAMTESSGALQNTADKLRAAADRADGTDRMGAERFTQARASMQRIEVPR